MSHRLCGSTGIGRSRYNRQSAVLLRPVELQRLDGRRLSPRRSCSAGASVSERCHLSDDLSPKHGQLGDTVGNPVGVLTIAFSPDGTLLATGSSDGTARLWDAASRTLVAEPINGHDSGVSSVHFSSDGRLLVTVGRTICLCDLMDTECPRKVGKPFSSALTAKPALSSDGNLAAGHANGAVQLWDLSTQTKLGGALRGHADAVTAIAFSPDGCLLARAGRDIQLEPLGSRRTRPDGGE
ncbi:hypothetical protein AB0O82_02275 [Kitasatospora sp. NPDC088264]|uniref:WD40 repeat domain-containing protein n=1 Tax=Kitasatospora sp. NPDC088264 TaxID=3155296 RepID=UPI00342863F0